MVNWDFYGRAQALEELRRIVGGGRWFFCRIEGRRRIGKSSLLSQLAKQDPGLSDQLIYMQVPDSDERDVATAFQRSLLDCEHLLAKRLSPTVVNFPTMARAIGELCQAGLVVVLDEFQYFTRAALRSFNSFLQAEVDKLRYANLKQGGVFILGSLQADMNALLDDSGTPLYGRITHRIKLQHWDFEELQQLFRAQRVEQPSQWLTLWTFFEGVPKFYHDAYEQGLFDEGPDSFGDALLAKMFVRSSSPLSEEAETWFLRELRGRSLSVLTFLAEHVGCSNGELLAGVGAPEDKTQIGAYLAKLVNAYEMIDKRNPVFADSKSRNARYYIADNFLQAWLAVAKPAREAFRLKPLVKVLELAKPRLERLEGFAFEKLIRRLHEECSQKGKGDFELSTLQMGYWNRSQDVNRSIELDLVALDAPNKRIRFGSCKRAASAHDNASLTGFRNHVDGFLAVREHRHMEDWSKELVVFSPVFTDGDRNHFAARGFGAKDLRDYAALF